MRSITVNIRFAIFGGFSYQIEIFLILLEKHNIQKVGFGVDFFFFFLLHITVISKMTQTHSMNNMDILTCEARSHLISLEFKSR